MFRPERMLGAFFLFKEEKGLQKYEVIKFVDNEFEMDVNVSPNEETVWLSLNDMSMLFGRDRSVIGKYIRKIYNDEELDKKRTWANFARVLQDGRVYNVDHYNLDMIIAIGYRVKSRRGVILIKILKIHK